jgi:hypothetical protein
MNAWWMRIWIEVVVSYFNGIVMEKHERCVV